MWDDGGRRTRLKVCRMKEWGRGWTRLKECGKMVEGWIRTRMKGGVCQVQVQVGGVGAWDGGWGWWPCDCLAVSPHWVAFFTTLG